MISDEDRQALSGLALKALDAIEEYGDDAQLGDAVIVFDVLVPDADDPEGTPSNHGLYRSTTQRTTIVSGLLRMTELYLSTAEPLEDD